MLSGILICVIIFSLAFEFINGFHDTANAIATSVYTRALTPKKAIALAAVMNLVGATASEKVALTISSGLVDITLEQHVILGALIGAIIWNLITWWKGIPSSSSHALIGSLIGATMMYTMGIEDIIWSGVFKKVILPLFTSPFIGLLVGFGFMKLLLNLCASCPKAKTDGIFRKLQVLSAALVAFSHGNNDAQKTMGIITMALIASEVIAPDAGVPMWVKIACACMMALGTSLGGWKIMKTMGGGVTKLEPASGFVAQTASALVIESMTFLGAPISTTQVITTSVMGVGSARRLSAVKWGVAQNILIAWIVTLPITMAFGAMSVFVIQMFI